MSTKCYCMEYEFLEDCGSTKYEAIRIIILLAANLPVGPVPTGKLSIPIGIEILEI